MLQKLQLANDVSDLENNLKSKRIKIHFSDQAKVWLADKGYDEVYGARPLRRVGTYQVIAKLS